MESSDSTLSQNKKLTCEDIKDQIPRFEDGTIDLDKWHELKLTSKYNQPTFHLLPKKDRIQFYLNGIKRSEMHIQEYKEIINSLLE